MLEFSFGGHPSAKPNLSHFFFNVMLRFEKGSQLILIVVLPRMSLSSETSFVLRVELQCLKDICLSSSLVRWLHTQGFYVSHFSLAPEPPGLACLFNLLLFVVLLL